MSAWKNLRVVKIGMPIQSSLPCAVASISEDNDISEHPGKGQILVVDSHPWPVIQPGTGGAYWRERIQAWDAAFRVDRDRILLHTVRDDGSLRPFWWASSARRVFWDNVPGKYYNASNPYASVNTPGSVLREQVGEVVAPSHLLSGLDRGLEPFAVAEIRELQPAERPG